MSNRYLKKGDRVTLSADARYLACDANPKEGSEWFCEGTIRKGVPDGTYFVYVDWDNGRFNSYLQEDSDLTLIDDIIPI